VKIDLPFFDPSPSPDELDACLADLDRALDTAFLADMESALVRAERAGAFDSQAHPDDAAA
jgi:hypothetical protein